MPRFHHGCPYRHIDSDTEAVVAMPAANLSAAAQPAPEKQTRFGFLFRRLEETELKTNAHLLTESPKTVNDLIALGEKMDDTPAQHALDSKIPAIFTYFGQFIAHDITWEKGTPDMTTLSEIKPWPRARVAALVNKRSGSLDLDCVYGQPPSEAPLDENGRLQISRVDATGDSPPGKSVFNDVPRKKHLPAPAEGVPEPEESRAAIIGDARNDANTIISQLHVAFLHAHNNLMKQGDTFADARAKLVRLYQTIVVEDYLKRIILPDVFEKFRKQPDLLYKGRYMPVEFSSAAFRFGHTMIRRSYELNLNFSKLPLEKMIGMPPMNYDRMPMSWIIEWERFVDGGSNLAHQISTQMVNPLSLLKDSPDNPFKLTSTETREEQSLAVRDLLRGYIFSLPTGQAVARLIGAEKEILKAEDFRELVPESQWQVLSNSEFLEKTPLWFYVLVEAAREKRNTDNDHLGTVGSHLVAGVLMGLLFRSTNSVLRNGNSPLGSTLSDLLRLAGVLSGNQQPHEPA
jgi:Animal haem peroxidase